MEKLLLLGVNTRPMINSALKLNYEIYSSSYYLPYDSKNINEIHLLNQEQNKNCGYFEDKYSPYKLLENSEYYLEICDFIILCSGITPTDFKGKYKKYIKKIIGNKEVKDIEDKYKFYKKNSKDFLLPKTFNKIDIYELEEILKNDVMKSYILKPVNGSGGYGIYLLNNDSINQYNELEKLSEILENETFILQEKIDGINISASLLSTEKNTKNIINSRLLNLNDYNKKSYKYSGNLLPLDKNTIKYKIDNENTIKNLNIEKINRKIKTITETLIKKLKLIGNNGVDMILSPNGEIYTIEVNPRLQGTYECIEKLFNINLLNAHIQACNNILIDLPPHEGYCIKKIIYTENKTKIGRINYENIYDIPYPYTIFEKDQPLLTLINKNKNLKEVYKNIEIGENKINNNLQIIN